MSTHTLIIERPTTSVADVVWLELIEHDIAPDDAQAELVQLSSEPTDARFDRVLEIQGGYNSWTAHRAVRLYRHPTLREGASK